MEWYAKEARGLQALEAPDWAEPELALAELASLEVRGDERWLAGRFPALRTLGLRGRPRPQLVPPDCHTLALSYQVPPSFRPVDPASCMTWLSHARPVLPSPGFPPVGLARS